MIVLSAAGADIDTTYTADRKASASRRFETLDGRVQKIFAVVEECELATWW